MGVSAKVLTRILDLSDRGLLPPGAEIMELGAQQLYCKGSEAFLAEFVKRVSARNPEVKLTITKAELERLADGGLTSGLLKACGYKYSAIDIFDAEGTILFDLNREEPSADMRNRYDIVTNFGTTEHIINQYLAFKTMHEMTKPGGIIYHELPLAGFHMHGYFSYNPLLFMQVAEANHYEIVMQAYGKNDRDFHPAPDFMVRNGFSDGGYYDLGIEFIFRKTADAPFRVPLETSTSLDVSPVFLAGLSRGGPGADGVAYGLVGEGRGDLAKFSGRELQRELLKRYKRRLLRILGLSK
jgi:hypothetical protein